MIKTNKKVLKIILIEANSNWLKNSGEEQMILPLGLMSVATYAKKIFKNKINIKIYDFIVDCNNNMVELKEIIQKEKPDIVGVRGVITYREEFSKICKLAKQNSKALIVGGGPYVTSDEYFGLKDSVIDIAVIGEGEITFREIITKYLKHQSLIGINGTAIKVEGEVIKLGDRPLIKDLDILPFPDYDLIDINKYAKYLTYGYNKRKQGVINTSRGCPYQCVFCHRIFGKIFRERSPENVIKEMKSLFNRGIKDFYFLDDIFNLNKNRARAICKMISSSKMKGKIRLYFVNGLRGDIIDHELIDALVDAGTIWLSYAIETASPRLQKVIGKNLDLDRVKDAIEYSASKGVIVNYWGLLGHPDETVKEAEHTVKFMEKLPPSIIPMLFSMKAYPGTKLYEQLKVKPTIFTTKYHHFFELVHNKPAYLNIIKKWEKMIYSKDRIAYATNVLLNNGYSPEEIESAYSILYHSLSKKEIKQIIKNGVFAVGDKVKTPSIDPYQVLAGY